MTNPDTQDESRAKSSAFVIVTSDTCFEDPGQDESGDYVRDKLEQTKLFSCVNKLIESDDKDKIIGIIDEVLTTNDPALIITVGGTGLTPRDVTPDATSIFYDKTCDGISTALHMNSLRYTPHAALSRLTAGIAGGTLIINFPGKLQACKDCIGCLIIILEHALEQVRYDHVAYSETHRRQALMASQQDQHLEMLPKNLATRKGSSVSSLISLGSGATPVANTFNGDDYNKNSAIQRALSANGVTLKQSSQPKPSSELSRRCKLSIQSIEESRSEMSSLEEGQSGSNTVNRLPRSDRVGSATPSKRFQPRSNSSISSRERPHSNIQPKTSHQTKPQPNNPAKPQPAPKPCPLLSTKTLQTHSPYQQISYKESLNILASRAAGIFDEKIEPVTINTFAKAFSVVGSMLAEDLHPKRIVPPFPVATMDGYVVNIPAEMKGLLDSIKGFSYYQVVDNMDTFERMQINNEERLKFFCCQINTGGRLPKFNYAIVPTEDAIPGECGTISFKELQQFRFVRGKGTDIGQNDIIKRGTVIGPVELSCIIAMDHKSFKVLQRPKIGVLSTGDELEDFFADKIISQDSVVDTNGPMLRSMFRSLGYHVHDGGVSRDEPEELLEKIGNLLKHCKVVLITGGASMGTRDHVKDVIIHMGGQIHFGRVDIKPGKPVAFASLQVEGKQKFIFSLPGNPVSAFVTSLVLTLPFLKHAPIEYLRLPGNIGGHLGENIWAEVQGIDHKSYRFDGRLEFLRAKLLDRKKEFIRNNSWPVYQVQVSVQQQSSRLIGLVDCDCLMMVDPSFKGKSLEKGEIFPAIKLNLKSKTI